MPSPRAEHGSSISYRGEKPSIPLLTSMEDMRTALAQQAQDFGMQPTLATSLVKPPSGRAGPAAHGESPHYAALDVELSATAMSGQPLPAAQVKSGAALRQHETVGAHLYGSLYDFTSLAGSEGGSGGLNVADLLAAAAWSAVKSASEEEQLGGAQLDERSLPKGRRAEVELGPS